MYADVVVLTYQSPEIQTYTYEVPKDLEKSIKIGQLVSVPFGKRNPIGVVLSTRSHLAQGETLAKLKIKPVSSIISLTPVLLPYQIDLAKWMASYYHAPMVNCLKTILPELPGKLLMGPINHSPFTIHQTLVLVPTINRLPETLAKYPQAKNYAVYHNELGTREKFSVWQKILSGTVNYIFGSRSAIFTPCVNLSKIIILDEHEPAYKDERSPYFDTLTIAEKLAQITGAKIEIIDTSPKVTTFYTHKKDIKIPKIETKTKIVSMLEEKLAGNRLPLSDLAITYLKIAHTKNKRALLFLNKKIESGHLYCRACKHNQYLSTCPETCPNCGTVDIWFTSLNIKSLKTLIAKTLPQAKINLIAEGYPRRPLDDTIDIATAAVFYKLATQKYDLTIHVAADTMLAITDFSATEKAYFQITNLKKVTKGLLLIQTYNPQNSTINFAAEGNYLAFFNSQIKERRALSYPPFAQLIKLTLKGKKEEDLQKKSQELFDNLIHSPFTINHSLSILGPYKSTFATAIARYNIIAKIPVAHNDLKSREEKIDKINNLLDKVPRNWQIETEPDSLL